MEPWRFRQKVPSLSRLHAFMTAATSQSSFKQRKCRSVSGMIPQVPLVLKFLLMLGFWRTTLLSFCFLFIFCIYQVSFFPKLLSWITLRTALLGVPPLPRARLIFCIRKTSVSFPAVI